MPAVAVKEVELRVQTPRAFLPLLAPNKRYRGAWGGRGGAKSWFFAELLIEEFIEDPTLRAVCVREFQKSLKFSSKQLIEDTIERLGVGRLFRILSTHIETLKGGVILFQGMATHTEESVKSLEGFKIAWLEEAQRISKRSLNLLRPTLFRVPGSEIWASWNPNSPKDPIDELLRGADVPEDAAVARVNWSDNPWFPEALRKELEWDRARDPDKYAHVWQGAYATRSEARVFKNWRIDEFDSPDDATYYYGADWGFSVDPSTLIRCRIDGRKMFIDHEAYRIGVEIDHLPALFDQVPGAREWPIRADSARPETISYLQRNGFPKMRSATKGPNSVKEGVIFLQNYDIVVHPRCIHTIDELTDYSYVVDRLTGRVTPLLADKKNHIIDPLRYATEEVRQPAVDDWLVV
jgi:phage terminase large subunit